MQDLGNDYIYIENFDGAITCPESLCVQLCDRHYGIGGDGIVLIECSDVADAKMRVFNVDGSEGKMAGNALRCVGKLLYDRGICVKDDISVETASGIKNVRVFTRNGKVGSATVDMGKAELHPSNIPVSLDGESVIARKVLIGGEEFEITCVSVGNPHCVVFVDRVDALEVDKIGPQFEYAPMFPERVNTEFIRVVNENTIKMRVWERGNGETLGCGTGACAAVVAAVENGLCRKGDDITVRLAGGDLVVNYTDEGITLTGGATLVYEGSIEY
jgi:carbamoyl-phosphate synthase large subunit